MLDPITVGIITVLGKYALDKGVELGKEVGPKALERAKETFTAALDRLRNDSTSEVIVNEYEKDPETYAKPLEKKLDAVVKEDPVFKTQMETLLKQYDEAATEHAATTGTSYYAVLAGSGAIAQGAGAKAVGERGVIVEGDVSGNIITGNNNIMP